MKNKINILFVIGLFVGVLLGCSSIPQVTSPSALQLAQGLIEQAAQDGTLYALTDKTNIVNATDLQLTASILQDLAGATNAIDQSEVISAVQKAGETNPFILTAISQAVQVTNQQISNNSTNAIVQNQIAQNAFKWIAAGITNELSIWNASE